jgi:hypothetical protein
MELWSQTRRGCESQADRARIAILLDGRADMTLPELQKELMVATGRRTSVPHLWRVVRGMGFRRKKVGPRPERDTEANQRRREAFVTELRTIPPERLFYLDESGFSTQMTRLYGRCRGGRRVVDAVPGGDWKMVTILGAMNHQGMLAAMIIEAATDREIFLAFLDDVHCPKLQAGDVLIMDNLSAHKVDGVQQRIEAMGARLLHPAALLARPQPHRESLGKAQSASPKRSGSLCRNTPQRNRPTPHSYQPKRRNSLVQTPLYQYGYG